MRELHSVQQPPFLPAVTVSCSSPLWGLAGHPGCRLHPAVKHSCYVHRACTTFMTHTRRPGWRIRTSMLTPSNSAAFLCAAAAAASLACNGRYSMHQKHHCRTCMEYSSRPGVDIHAGTAVGCWLLHSTTMPSQSWIHPEPITP